VECRSQDILRSLDTRRLLVVGALVSKALPPMLLPVILVPVILRPRQVLDILPLLAEVILPPRVAMEHHLSLGMGLLRSLATVPHNLATAPHRSRSRATELLSPDTVLRLNPDMALPLNPDMALPLNNRLMERNNRATAVALIQWAKPVHRIHPAKLTPERR